MDDSNKIKQTVLKGKKGIWQVLLLVKILHFLQILQSPKLLEDKAGKGRGLYIHGARTVRECGSVDVYLDTAERGQVPLSP